MRELFSNIDIDQFLMQFSNESSCLEFLNKDKWKEGYVCRKCGNLNHCRGKTPFSKRCTRCKHEESATSHTIFHRCKIPVQQAFYIVFLVCNTPGISTYEISRVLNLRQMTCWKFKKKIIECLEQKGELEYLEEK